MGRRSGENSGPFNRGVMKCGGICQEGYKHVTQMDGSEGRERRKRGGGTQNRTQKARTHIKKGKKEGKKNRDMHEGSNGGGGTCLVDAHGSHGEQDALQPRHQNLGWRVLRKHVVVQRRRVQPAISKPPPPAMSGPERTPTLPSSHVLVCRCTAPTFPACSLPLQYSN